MSSLRTKDELSWSSACLQKDRWHVTSSIAAVFFTLAWKHFWALGGILYTSRGRTCFFFLLVSISHEISRGAGEEQRWEQRLIVLLLAIYFEMASFLVRTSHVLEEANKMVVIRRVQFLRLRVALKWPRVTVARSLVRSEANSHYNVNFFFFL